MFRYTRVWLRAAELPDVADDEDQESDKSREAYDSRSGLLEERPNACPLLHL